MSSKMQQLYMYEGAAIVPSLSPIVANIFMESLEESKIPEYIHTQT